MRGSSVLVIDDDESGRELLRRLLERAGAKALLAPDGVRGLRMLYEHRPHLVILDVEMPELDGWRVLERIRELSDIPVLMLTGRGLDQERVRGLQTGADDYVVKPFNAAELLARIEALLRRSAPAPDVRERYDDGALAVDYAQHMASVHGRPLQLTPLEFRLLSAFARHPGQVLSHDQLLELAWGGAERASRDQVKLYIGYLRRKLRAAGLTEPCVETVRGFGYRYVARAGR